MKRSVSTLRGYANRALIRFPDYVPPAMRPVVTLHKMGDFYEAFGDDAKVEADGG